MKAELRSKWLVALRSGNYKQGVKQLHDPQTDTYCCLGVLCEVAEIPKIVENALSDYDFGPGKGKYHGSIPVGIWGVSRNTNQKLMDMNDNEGRSFSEIADWIEQNIPEE